MIEDIAVIIPAYDPEDGLIRLTEECKDVFANIVVVDDGCAESYQHIFKAIEGSAVVLRHEVNKGKGRALKTAFSYVFENLPSVKGVLTLDADGQHTITDSVRCCERFLEDPTQAVFGCRDFESDEKIPPRSRFGNRLTSRLMKFFCDINLSDTQTGLRVIPATALKDLLQVPGERYEYEMNMIFYFKEKLIPFTEVPIQVIYIEDNASSHFNPIVDSIKIYAVFFKFVVSSFGSALLDLVLFRVFSKYIFESIFPSHFIEISTAAARVCSGAFNYSFNRSIFKSRSKVAKSGARYLVLWLVQMTLSAYTVKFLTALTGFTPLLVKIVTDTVLFFISYKIQQLWVFKPERT